MLKPLFADALGMAEFEDALFRKKVDFVWVLSETEMEMHLADGSVQALLYEPPKRKGLPRTEEQKEHMRKVMQSKWTPERKAEMSERMKQMRKERGENWRKEK